ncbi:hypothetical protein [Frankia sp. R82]|uniref:hypothetical protein n=1 Tax=Frankia sp. R82 TaxID=2950553 RepID=UPI00204352EF|nr:hypothetical protein [Frankia sp. R82]MCM3884623.1 hypothetical protein [Frankia sp. R82]
MTPRDAVPLGYLQDPAPVKMTVPAGWWRLRRILTQPGRQQISAELFTTLRAPALQVEADLHEIDGHLGFPLTAQMRERLRTAEPELSFVAPYPTVTMEQLDRNPKLRPWRASRVDLARAPSATYGRLHHTDPPLRSWLDPAGDIQIEILAAAATTTPAGPQDRLALDLPYRVRHEGLVALSGRSARIPARIDPTSDTALRAVLEDLTTPRSEPLTPRQSRALDASRYLRRLITDFEVHEGSRVAIEGPVGFPHSTGTVRRIDVRPSGEHTLWRPDVADLPGHPWNALPNRVMSTPAERVLPTLMAKNTVVGGPYAPAHLVYGALISTVDDPASRGGTVLRALTDAGTLTYEFQPVEPDQGPREISATDVVPVAGTAWPDLRTLLEARLANHVDLVAGEHLITLREAAPVVHSPTGPTLGRITPVFTGDPALDPDLLAAPPPAPELDQAPPPPDLFIAGP